jgi:hypothetical protein
MLLKHKQIIERRQRQDLQKLTLSILGPNSGGGHGKSEK